MNRLIIHIQIKGMRVKDSMYIHDKKKASEHFHDFCLFFINNNVEFIYATGRHYQEREREKKNEIKLSHRDSL